MHCAAQHAHALKQFHDGGDAVADLIDERPSAALPTPDTDVPMVSRSVRLPLDTYERVRAAADARGLGVTTLMRQWIGAGWPTWTTPPRCRWRTSAGR